MGAHVLTLNAILAQRQFQRQQGLLQQKQPLPENLVVAYLYVCFYRFFIIKINAILADNCFEVQMDEMTIRYDNLISTISKMPRQFDLFFDFKLNNFPSGGANNLDNIFHGSTT